ncbi:MAG: hypothetical protein JSU86_06515 [Phycisphaerales bacterium]|nr:MAG: hypothetical protein JSU86_06515 [Phycisphaerales bacterium]
MPRSKRGPALFDLLSQDEATEPETDNLPGGRGPGQQSRGATEAAPTLPGKVSGPAGPLEARSSTGGDGPFIELDGDRIRISLTSVTAAVAVFAAMVIALGVFEVGRRLGEQGGLKRGHAAGRASYVADAMSDIEAARSQPPATELISDLLRQTAADGAVADAVTGETAADSEGPDWIRDHTYIVAQEFSAGRRDDAQRAREFLVEHGVATELVRYPSGAIQLITTQGYNREDPTQREMSDQALRKVHAVGAQYFASGGGYKLEGYFKTLKSDSW